MNEGEELNLVVATTYSEATLMYAKLIPSILKIGSQSPLASFTLR